MIKIQLYNESLGSYTVNPDAIGTAELEQELKRSEKDDGVVYEYSLDLDFTKGARDYIRRGYETQGIQCVIIANIFEYLENSFDWENIGTGKIDFVKYEISAEKVTTNIEQTGFQRKVLNLIDVDVDLDATASQAGIPLPVTPVLTLELHPKKIIQQTVGTPTDGTEFSQGDVFEFFFNDDGDPAYRNGVMLGQVDNSNSQTDEIEDSFKLPFGFLYLGLNAVHVDEVASMENFLKGLDKDGVPRSDAAYTAARARNEIYSARFAGIGKVNLRWKLEHSIYARNDGGDVDIGGSGILGDDRIQCWFEIRDANGVVKQLTEFGTPKYRGDTGGEEWVPGDYHLTEYSQDNIIVEVGDKWYAYFTHNVFGGYEEPSEGAAGDGHVWHEPRVKADVSIAPDGKPYTYVDATVDTEYPATTTKAHMIFEALKKIAGYYTDQVDSFRSDYFGRTDTVPAYPVDGPGSLCAITNGRAMRKLENQTIFSNMQDAFQSLNALHCLSMGFETVDGKQVLRVEPKDYFWNKNSLILDLGLVSKLEKRVAPKYYYNQVEVGFTKLDIQQTNAIDEFTTLRRFKLAITEISSKLNIVSKYKASGFEIESQRRLIGQTKDSKLDDANFLINVVRDGEGFKTEQAENYPEVENLYDSDSAYNLDFAPARTLRKWSKVLAACVTKLSDKFLRFTYGEGNYEMTSRRSDETTAISEKGNVDLTDVEPLYIPEIYSFERGLTKDEMRQIRLNPYGYFTFKEVEDGPTLEGYLLRVRRDSNKKKGTFELLRVYRKTA